MPLITQQITDIYTSKNIAGQLDNLELICKKSLNADEESQVIECIKLVKNRIDLAFHEMSPSDYETEQLSADIFKLKRITDYFLGQVQHNASRVQTLNSEIDAWADSWKKGKERPDVYKVEDLLPPEDVLSSASLSQLVAYQMRIKALMRDLDAEDQGLLKLYWQAYNRVLVHLQKQTVDCPEPGLGSSITPMTIDLTTPSAATTIFALMNLGDVDIHSGSFSPSACLTLSFMIKSLEEMLAENILPADDKAKMAQLLKSYKAGYRILLFEETALRDAQQANSLQAYADAKQRIRTVSTT